MRGWTGGQAFSEYKHLTAQICSSNSRAALSARVAWGCKAKIAFARVGTVVLGLGHVNRGWTLYPRTLSGGSAADRQRERSVGVTGLGSGVCPVMFRA